MGLSGAITAGIVLVVLTYIILLMPSILDKTSVIHDASSEISNIETEILNTDISLSNSVVTVLSPSFTFDITNDDIEKLWDFKNFDIVVTYEGEISGRLTESIDYDGSCGALPPATGKWCIDTFTGDLADPGVLNETELMTVGVTLNENVAAGIFIITVSTDNGVTSVLARTV